MKFWPIFLLVSLLAACTSANANQPILSQQGLEPTETGEISQPSNSDPLPDEEANTLMYQLSQNAGSGSQEAVETIIAENDTRFIAVFIEILRANQIGLLRGTSYQTPINALETLRSSMEAVKAKMT